MKNIKAQLEMTFEATCRPVTQPQRRARRAHRWFDRMRQAVERAIDYSPPRRPRPEQPVFPHVYRQPLAPAPAKACHDQGQVQLQQQHRQE